MKTIIEEIAKSVPFYQALKTLQNERSSRLRQQEEIRDWIAKGRPAPPPHVVKQQTVKAYGKQFSLQTLIETGTYLGHMVFAMKGSFGKIISIELDVALYESAKQNFANFEQVAIVHGDSGERLPVILETIKQPCLFWLDGHYSAGITARGRLDTPIISELRAIFNHDVTRHVVLIDDARCFIGQDDYPTLRELESFVHQRRPDWNFEVKDDIVRIHQPENRRR